MTSAPTVSNASPLIALQQIDHLYLLERLFGAIWIAPAVSREIAPTVILPGWIEQRELTQPIGPRILGASLGPGESEAISLALEAKAGWVILDDKPARRLAQALHLSVIGTLGILMAAKRRHFIASIKPCLDALLECDFRIALRLYERVLHVAGEDRGRA